MNIYNHYNNILENINMIILAKMINVNNLLN